MANTDEYRFERVGERASGMTYRTAYQQYRIEVGARNMGPLPDYAGIVLFLDFFDGCGVA